MPEPTNTENKTDVSMDDSIVLDLNGTLDMYRTIAYENKAEKKEKDLQKKFKRIRSLGYK